MRTGFDFVIPSANIESTWLGHVVNSETPKAARTTIPQPSWNLRPGQGDKNQTGTNLLGRGLRPTPPLPSPA